MSSEWSIHAAAGTNNYMFIWEMAGENLIHRNEISILDFSYIIRLRFFFDKSIFKSSFPYHIIGKIN